jgi:hypothetical protein
MTATVVIGRRFNGPPDSGNGGYSCGLLARAIDGPAEVTLRQPPPLEHALRVTRDGERALLVDGDGLVAEAVSTTPDWEVPSAPVSMDAARAAVVASPFLKRPRPFVTCFVCGPDREPHDGLCIFPGPVDGRDDLFAGTWRPHESLATDDGRVPPEVVWAALDCPTSGPVANRPDSDWNVRPIVLARLAAELLRPVDVGRELLVVAWPVAFDGRKRHAGSALFTPEGELVASARALWIELRDADATDDR